MDKVFILHFLGILRHAWGHYLSIPDLLNNVPSIRTLGPFICTFWGYSRHTSRLKPLSIRTRLVEPFTTNKADRAFMRTFCGYYATNRVWARDFGIPGSRGLHGTQSRGIHGRDPVLGGQSHPGPLGAPGGPYKQLRVAKWVLLLNNFLRAFKWAQLDASRTTRTWDKLFQLQPHNIPNLQCMQHRKFHLWNKLQSTKGI